MGDWGLVGRDEEMALLAAACSEHSRGLVISGAMGVGKSRLAADLLDQLRGEGLAVISVRATRSMASIPFGVFAAYIDDAPAQGLGRLEALRRIADALTEKAGEDRLVIGVDDAHLLDDGSAAVLAHLAHLDRALIVATVRSEEVAPDALVSLWRDGAAERYELQPLSRAETERLLRNALGGEVTGRTSARLWTWVQGNPLFLREVLRVGIARGSLICEGGVWRWEGTLPDDARLSEVVLGSLHDVDEAERAVLEVLAIGEPVDVEIMADLCGEEPMRAAERDGLIVMETVGTSVAARLSHPLYGELLVASMPPMRAKGIRALLADAVEAGPSAAEELLRVATWRLDGQGSGGDPAMFIAASRRALVIADYELAGRLAAAAEGAGGGFCAVSARAEALYWQGRTVEAEALFSSLDLATAPTPRDLSHAALCRASGLFFGLGRAADASRALTRAVAYLGRDPTRFDLLAHQASLLLFEGQAERAADQAVAVLADPEAGVEARLRALQAASAAWAVQGRRSASIGAAEVALPEALAMAAVLPELAGELVLAQCIADTLAGELSSAEGLVASIHAMATAEGAVDYIGSSGLFLGRVVLSQGKVASAAEHLRAAAVTLGENDPGGFLPWCFALLAHAEAQRGHRAAADEAMAQQEASRNGAIHVYDCEIELARAWVAASNGSRSEARQAARRAVAAARAGGMAIAEMAAWHDLARLGEPREAVAHLEVLQPLVEGAFGVAYLNHARALDREDGVALDGVASVFEALGAMLLAAEAAARAAEIHRAAGRTGSHLSSLARARSLLQHCEDAVTTQVRTVDHPAVMAELTEREREVVELAATGLTNREIADRLVVSIRTVNSHLNHAYAKIGSSDRDVLRHAVGLS